MSLELVVRELVEGVPVACDDKTLAPVTPQAQEMIQAVARELRKYPQVDIETEEHLHAGVYSRTCKFPKGTVACGALIKRTTQMVMYGHMRFNNGMQIREYKGYHVFEGQAGRAQIGYALEDTWFTVFAHTDATTLEEARKEFTDEQNLLENEQ